MKHRDSEYKQITLLVLPSDTRIRVTKLHVALVLHLPAVCHHTTTACAVFLYFEICIFNSVTEIKVQVSQAQATTNEIALLESQKNHSDD